MTGFGQKLLLSVPEIDREHLELIIEVDEFASCADGGASRPELVLRMSLLLKSFDAHFTSEEGLMRSSGYPGLAGHAEEHRKLLEQMSALLGDLEAGVVQL